ncbi:inositol 1,4,5-triphosphate receptor associated 2 isoform X4 [Osmerus eperlanus]|uniref:inositol 1,4,5-triphosphate receptor associated 2 isoform X4 n=1 Tax=Osmerus eperlanus TaxID=29151 RepID=UPI002E0EB531
MSAQLPHESAQCEYAGILGDSDDSDEEPCPSDKLAVAWDDLPILERLGLTSGADMTEEEVESEFSKLAMAFRCDQYTLSQRLQAEEHDRVIAQENLTLELQRARDSLEALRGRCADSERSHMLSCIDTSLDTVLGSMEDIISTAEMLGAVHQEARVSCSVELMQTHMQHLRLRHSAHNVQLQETRKLLHRCRGRIHSDSAEDGDVRQLFVRQGSQQHLMRRRVSVTLLPTQAQLSDLEVRFMEGCRAGGDTDSQGPTEDAVSHTTSPSPSHSPAERSFLLRQNSSQSTQSLEDDNDPRRKSAIQEWEGSTEEAEVKESTTRSPPRPGARSTEELSQLSSSDSVSVDQSVIPTQQRPLQSWLSLLCCILLVLAFFLLCFLWIVLSLHWGFAYSHRNGHTAI